MKYYKNKSHKRGSSIGECEFRRDVNELIWKSEEASLLSKINSVGEVKRVFSKSEKQIVANAFEQPFEGLQHESGLKNKWSLTVESKHVKYGFALKF